MAAAAQRDSDDTAAEGHKQGVMVFVQLQPENPAVLLTLNITPTHTENSFRMSEHKNFSRQENQNIPLRFSLGWVVDVNVLQQLGSHAVVGMRAGQNLEDSAILRAQEHDGPVLGQSSGDIDHNLGQFGSVRTKPKGRDEGEGSLWIILHTRVRETRCFREPGVSVVPAGGPGETWPLVDRGNGLVHQRIRLDEGQHLIRKLNRRLVLSGGTVTCTRSGSGEQRNPEHGTIAGKAGFSPGLSETHRGCGTSSSATGVHDKSLVRCSLNFLLKTFSISSM